MIKARVRIKGDLMAEFEAAKEAKRKQAIEHLIALLVLITPKKTGYTASRWQTDNKGNIINDGVAISYLNDGSSEKAPAHFIEQTLLSQKGVKPSGSIVRPL